MSALGESEQALRVLLDKQEIHEVLMRYCRAIDRVDEELLRSVYYPEAWDDHVIFRGPAKEFVPFVLKFQLERYSVTTHAIMNELFEVEGDTAWGESYYMATCRFERDGAEYDRVSGGRYIDRFERRDGAWRIARRVVVSDWARVEPAKSESTAPVVGLRSREDLAYQRI